MPGPGIRWIIYRMATFGLFIMLFVYHELTGVFVAAFFVFVTAIFFLEKYDRKGRPLKKVPFSDDAER